MNFCYLAVHLANAFLLKKLSKEKKLEHSVFIKTTLKNDDKIKIYSAVSVEKTDLECLLMHKSSTSCPKKNDCVNRLSI